MNKRINILLLLNLLLCIPVQLAQAEPVKRISDAYIQEFKQSLQAQESLRHKIMWLSAGGLLAGTAGIIGHIWYKDYLEKQNFDNLLNNYGRLNADKKETVNRWVRAGAALEEGLAPKEDDKPTQPSVRAPWLSRAKTWITDKVKDEINKTPDVLWTRLKEKYLFTPEALILFVLPKSNIIYDYLFTPRTISRFIKKQTCLDQSIKDTTSWIDQSSQEGALQSLDNSELMAEELESIVNVFVVQIEKVLAFMSYIADKLPIADIIDRQRANIVMKKIRSSTEYFCKAADEICDNDQISELSDFVKSFERAIMDIANQLVSFQSIEALVGFKDDVPTKPLTFLQNADD